MLDERVAGIVEFRDDARRLRLRLHAGELDALLDLHELHAAERAEKIEMPPGPAILAVGDRGKADRLLLLHEGADFLVLDLAERVRVDLAALAPRARLLEPGAAQQGADMVGAKGGRGALHGGLAPYFFASFTGSFTSFTVSNSML